VSGIASIDERRPEVLEVRAVADRLIRELAGTRADIACLACVEAVVKILCGATGISVVVALEGLQSTIGHMLGTERERGA